MLTSPNLLKEYTSRWYWFLPCLSFLFEITGVAFSSAYNQSMYFASNIPIYISSSIVSAFFSTIIILSLTLKLKSKYPAKSLLRAYFIVLLTFSLISLSIMFLFFKNRNLGG